ncbi:glycoside hydrolase family 3 protein [Rhizodiscina lignyota]|uniref:xylan 1,4-beta-xylosidase n=1 Tax=Rhizodiscina lignyota TaxID=1504668 RepID=A0A9P4MB58_9PEZI|nr:glycoside hydrolase family 3 protein [Rhizodiscina lignyota]
MIAIGSLLAVLGAVTPSVLAQNNPVGQNNYSSQSQPDLTFQTVETITLGFPDCQSGPLASNPICDTSLDPSTRVAGLLSALTLDELISLSGNTAYGVPRLGLPPYQVWNEALHGLDRANNSLSGDFAWATSFPMPILSMAGMNRTMINFIASIISTQARAFNNAKKYGLDVYAPNINGFRSPIWGRGQETPGEDARFLSALYAYEYITGMQGGVNPKTLKIAATPKHFYGYDLENWNNQSRLGLDVTIAPQDLAEYYTPQFLTSISYAKARSLMCSYNAVNGVPSCANSFALETLLRNEWGFDKHFGYVSTDCDAAYNIYNPHEYAHNESSAAADAIRAGADIDCGTTYQYHLNESIASGYIARTEIETAIGRLYTQLVETGFFDGPDAPYRDLTWNDVLKTDAWNISYEAAVEGMTLLKNDGTLPLSKKIKSVALIGPWSNATTDLQGNYFGPAPYLISPLEAFSKSGLKINYELGTTINSLSTVNFTKAINAAKKSDAIIFAGGINNEIEAEGADRFNVSWPGNQLDLISQLGKLGKPLVVLQFGGGQVDSTSIKNNKKVNSILWAGYPGQSGGQAVADVVTGKRTPAGRLVSTQYPASYVSDFPQTDMGLRPNKSSGNPGQTYMWYTGKPVYEFGYGIFYTTFEERPHKSQKNSLTVNIGEAVGAAHVGYEYIEQAPIVKVTIDVENTGKTASDYSAMLFASTKNAGPAPYPNKWLVGIDRLATIKPGKTSTFEIDVPIGALARVDDLGNSVLYPGTYKLALNTDQSVVVSLKLTGTAVTLAKWPSELQEIPQA